MFNAIVFSDLCCLNGVTSGRYWIEAFGPFILAYRDATTSNRPTVALTPGRAVWIRNRGPW
jgi:hypothetical protein